MHILFTGGSSFTGFWFIKELVDAGHQVTAIFRSGLNDYSGPRLERVKQLLPICRPVFNCTFGSDFFLAMIEDHPHWDILCHHAADVADYKSPTFNPIKALANNTRGLRTVLKKLKARGCRRIALTGSVFEKGEGAGSEELRAISGYGLSKGMTSDVFQFEALLQEMALCKFVIPNPFGPFEEARFTTLLIREWINGGVATVQTPDYVRDNIHVSLLAKTYAEFLNNPEKRSFNPSGYIESQGAFSQRFALEMRSRLNLPCEIYLNQQTDFPEPKVRINTDALNPEVYHWDESDAWDDLAKFYQETYMKEGSAE